MGYKVIVVDDEMLIRKRIIYGFEWEELGYEIENEAGDGLQALALMEKKTYDLAIVDIAMPEINGIELARRIRERQYQTHIIFLTGHSDFQYARQAVKYGVFNYILKPIDGEEFINVLTELREKIDGEQMRKSLLDSLSEKQDNMDVVLKAKTFSEYFHAGSGTLIPQKVYRALEESGICNGYDLALIRVEMFLKDSKEWTEQVSAVEEISSSLWGREKGYLIIYDFYRDLLVLLLEHGEAEQGSRETMEQMRRLAEALEKQSGGDVQCGISRWRTDFSQLGDAYMEAVSALNNGKILNKKLLPYEAVLKNANIYYKIPFEELKNLQRGITEGQYEECRKILAGIFREMGDRGVNFECVVRNVNRLFMELADGGVVSEPASRRFFNGYHGAEQMLDNMANMAEIEEWCSNVVFTIMENEIRRSLENKSLPIVEKTCAYIRSHYEEGDLNQVQIAEAMAVTAPYLSGIFKKTMGISMVQYITVVRMERARELLRQPELEIKEIAALVGYNDEYYFSRCFKKQFGLSPLQMRKLSDSRRIKRGKETSGYKGLETI